MVYIDIPGYKKMYMNDLLASNLERVKKAVKKHGWDYVCVVSGLPGVGKSTFAQQLAKFFDPNFESWQICFTAKEFREKTINGNKGQAFILDESFADMNSSLYKDPEFVATLNHLQLIRQRNLFLILVLPDFFSLSKNLAIFRSSHLFVPYAEDYNHGSLAVFDREAKRELFIKGKPFVNYQARSPNFRCQYFSDWFCDEADYLKRKDEHLRQMAKPQEKGVKAGIQRDMCAALWHENSGMQIKDMAILLKMPESTVGDWVRRGKEKVNARNKTKTDL